MAKRLQKVLKYLIIIGILGLLYGVFTDRTGMGIPCVFHLITGFKCPGCGVTHMFLSLMKLDIGSAYHSNEMLFLLLPVLALILIRQLICYVRLGNWRLGRLETGILYGCIVLLLGFTVVRNLGGI